MAVVLIFPFLFSFSLDVNSDLDECSEGGHDCLSNQLCMNTIGSFKCMCPRGYKSDDSQRRCQGNVCLRGRVARKEIREGESK